MTSPFPFISNWFLIHGCIWVYLKFVFTKAHGQIEIMIQWTQWTWRFRWPRYFPWISSWLASLVRKDPKKVHKDFRLWLTSYPSNKLHGMDWLSRWWHMIAPIPRKSSRTGEILGWFEVLSKLCAFNQIKSVHQFINPAEKPSNLGSATWPHHLHPLDSTAAVSILARPTSTKRQRMPTHRKHGLLLITQWQHWLIDWLIDLLIDLPFFQG